MNNLIFFSSPIGLGHVTRDIAISEYLEPVPKFVTGAGAVQLLEQKKIPVEDLYHPPQFNVKGGFLQGPSKWLWRYYRYYKECKKISADVLNHQNPTLVLSDEDFASLTVAQEKNIPTIAITDIIATRFTTGFTSFIEKKMNKSMRDIMKRAKYTIIPEIGEDSENFRYVGPIVRNIKKSREELRKEFSFNKKTVVVTIGGTDLGEFLIHKTIEAFQKLNEDYELIIVSGPSLKKEFATKAKNLGFVNNLHEIIYASDLIISLAGKSTIDESVAYGTPGIFIPIKNHFEQEDNAKAIGYTFKDIDRLEHLIPEKLEQKRNPVKNDGAKKAANIIKSVLE